ncbi:DNA repair and recombination protein rhm52 [Pyricularia grisea]|uniref:RAD52 homolog n=1 Tax=Pyricularia grisea TaxID=148305 RepID=A0A6P8BH19_PYRGI|nr:uncharacterized protein PgNI_00227 [Pyricularia grisea]KAI6352584.1 DNA repair and recombination protein rhm52 [Pyricularia grisea]TLD16166.1 hypothetical protein PgNI_00227 [Pyricularia grisea]
MPAPGDQHSRISNPFEDVKPRISEYTAQEIATLQTRLERQLGPEYLSARAGPSGQKVHYVAAEKVIGLANEVFGFNGWSSSIQNIQVDFVDEHPQTLKISLGLHVVVRVTLRDGTFHEDIGYGHIENCKGKAMAFEKAKKEGTTDALKRALRNFGNVLGNCVYDKAYLAKVTKLKVEPTKFDELNLHRHADFAKKEVAAEPRLPPVKPEPSNSVSAPPHPPLPPLPDSFDDLLGEFDEADFCVVDADSHPDEVVLPENSHTSGSSGNNAASTTNRGLGAPSGNQSNQQRPVQPPSRINSTNGPTGRPQPQTPNHQIKRSGPQNSYMNNQQNNHGIRPPPQISNQGRPPPPPQNNNNTSSSTGQQQRPLGNGQQQNTPPQPNNGPPNAPNGAEPVAFFSARAVARVPDDAPIAPPPGTATPAVLFNPKAESPSIRKTPGIDHSSSRPVSRTGQHVPGKAAQDNGGPVNDNPSNNTGNGVQPQQQKPQPSQQRGSILNPQFDQSRRIGAPGGAASPLSNRNQYRPPTMMKRPPLADVPNGTTNGNGTPGDAKRMKLN